VNNQEIFMGEAAPRTLRAAMRVQPRRMRRDSIGFDGRRYGCEVTGVRFVAPCGGAPARRAIRQKIFKLRDLSHEIRTTRNMIWASSARRQSCNEAQSG
jgi:hypothetical protein